MARMLLPSVVGVALVTSLVAPALAENVDTTPKTQVTPSGLPMRGNGRVTVDMPLSAFTPAEPKISPYLYLNRCTGNCTVHGGTINDARTDTSAIPAVGDYTISEYKDAAGNVGSMADAEWAQVVQCMKEVYSPFAVMVTDQKPQGVSYTMAIIAGTPTEIGLDNTILGIAPLAGDCSAQDNVISFSFANHHGTNERVNNICWTAAQETAHAFGLDHEYQFSDGTSACNDPMTYRFDCGGQKFFRNKAAQCGEDAVRTCRCGGSQNSHVKIRSVFGDGTSLIPPPTCMIVSPTGGTISTGGVVAANAGSRRGVGKVELWLNNFKWAEKPGAAFGANGQLNPSTYSIVLPAGVPDGTIDIVVKAYDDLGAETDSQMVRVTKGSCNSAETCHCATGQKYDDQGRCIWDAPVGELGADCGYPQFCKSGICTETDQGGFCSQDCIVASSDACPMGFQCIATGASTGQCLPEDQGGCCSVGTDRNAVWLHMGIGATVLGLIARRRRRRR
jgi:MYXO-CTERM domain-containing protein